MAPLTRFHPTIEQSTGRRCARPGRRPGAGPHRRGRRGVFFLGGRGAKPTWAPDGREIRPPPREVAAIRHRGYPAPGRQAARGSMDWCRSRESNPDGASAPGDFKSPASASSATPASVAGASYGIAGRRVDRRGNECAGNVWVSLAVSGTWGGGSRTRVISGSRRIARRCLLITGSVVRVRAVSQSLQGLGPNGLGTWSFVGTTVGTRSSGMAARIACSSGPLRHPVCLVLVFPEWRDPRDHRHPTARMSPGGEEPAPELPHPPEPTTASTASRGPWGPRCALSPGPVPRPLTVRVRGVGTLPTPAIPPPRGWGLARSKSRFRPPTGFGPSNTL
jgi:hypothetical protein